MEGTGGLLPLIREDRRIHRSWLSPGFQALAVHRFGAWRLGLPAVPRKLLSPLYRLGALTVQNLYGIVIPPTVDVGRRVNIPYGGKIVISPKVAIGDDSILRHNVTIGAGRTGDAVPTLGRRVGVGTGAVILGRIHIGDFAEIGPNAVVLTDVPAKATVFADPGRVVMAPKPAWENAQSARVQDGR